MARRSWGGGGGGGGGNTRDTCRWNHIHVGWYIITPRAHARSGVKQSVLSVSQSVSQSVVCRLSVRRKKLNFCHIDPHKPSKGSQTIANSKKLLYVYLTEVKALRLGCFSSYFLLFVTFGPTSSTSQCARCCIYGKWSLPHLGYGHTRTQYTR